MTEKERNTIVARKVASSAFWNGEIFTRYFDTDFTMDMPSAPPGMPMYYTTWEAERCFEWLNRSVRSWKSEISEFYSTPDPNLFWVEGRFGGEVFWGEQDGVMDSEFFMKLEFKNGKVSHISLRFNTWAMLLAAGKRPHTHCGVLPTKENGEVDEYDKGYLINLYTPDIDEYMANPTFGEIPVGQAAEDFDTSTEAIRERREINIYQFACGHEREKYRKIETLNENYHKIGCFANMQGMAELMEGEGTEEKKKRMFAWNKLCSPWMYRDPRSKFYVTDDPNVWFVEMNAHGPGCWRANGITVGHYKQDYLVKLILDDLGRLILFEEVIGPVNGINSVGGEIPNFPYYH